MNDFKGWFYRALVLALIVAAGLVYYEYVFRTGPRLNKRELSYLANNSPLEVGVDSEFPPFEFVDEDGQIQGLTVDYLKLMAARMGLEFKFVPCNWHACVRQLKNGDLDVLGNVTPTSERNKFMSYTRNIFPNSSSIYVPEEAVGVEGLEDLRGRRVGVKKTTSIIEELKQHEALDLVRYPDSGELVEALQKRQVDAVVDYDYPFRRALYKRGVRSVKKVGPHVKEEEGTFAVRRGEDVLLSVLRKGVESITRTEKTRLVEKWLGERSYLFSLFNQYYYWFYGAGFIVLLLAVWNLSLRYRVRARTRKLRESERRYRRLFENSPVSLLEMDFSSVVDKVKRLEQEGVEDLEKYLEENPEQLRQIISAIQVKDVNSRTARLYGARDASELLPRAAEIFTEKTYPAFARLAKAVGEGRTNFETETVTRTLAGENKDIFVRWIVPSGAPQGYSTVYVAIVDISRRRQIERELEQSLREKNVLLQEVHHRVKNNLSKIISLLEMQTRRIENSRAVDALQQSVNRISTMALIHRKIYSAEKFDELNFGSYLESLVEDLRQTQLSSQDRVEVDYDLEAGTMGLNKIIPCALAVNELVTNALVHGIPDGVAGKLKIKFRTSGNDCRVTVADNGRGLPAGFSISRDASLGLMLVSSLVEDQLRGTLSYDSNGWTEFEINFTRDGG